MLQVVKDSQYYSDIDQIINSLELLNQKVSACRYPMTKCEMQIEIDYIIVGLKNSKEKGCLK